MSDGRYGYASRSSQAGTIGHHQRAIRDDWNTGAGTTGVVEYNRYIGAAGNAMPIGMVSVTGSTGWGGHAGTVRQHVSDRHHKLTIRNNRNARFDLARVTNNTWGFTRQIDSA